METFKIKNEKLLNYALESLNKGISVIPVGKNKRPLIPWKEFQTRYATEEEVIGWFETFDDPQIGFVTGQLSNLTVVDIEKGGDPSFLPQNTTIVQSGNCGYHYYFFYEEGVSNSARIKELVDIRSKGGYIVSPNSVSDKGSYKILQEKPLLPFPKELFPEKVDIFAYPESRKNIPFEKRELESYTGFSKGQRNDEMARYIGYVLTQVHPADWDTQGFSIIEKANSLNMPPLNPRELLATFESIKGIERRNNPLGHTKVYTNDIQKIEEDTYENPETDDSVKYLHEVAEAQKIDQDDVYPLEMPIFDQAILGGVCPGDVVTIAGQPSHGKTSLCQDWTISMIRGNRKTKALWFSYEVLASHLWNKFKEMGLDKEDCVFIPANHTDGNVAWVEKKIKEAKEKYGIKTVFIDHLGFLLPKTKGVLGKNLSSNYSTFLTQIMRDLKTVAIKEEIIIFLPVHMRKPDNRNRRAEIEDISGSAGPAQESDLVFLIEREKNTDEKIKSYFTNVTKISLVKNRKTGITVIAKFFMLKGRYSYDGSEAEAEEIFNSFKCDDEEEETKIKEVKKAKKILKDDESDLKDVMEDLWDKEVKH